MGSSILRVVGVFLKADVVAPVPVPVTEPGFGAAGPAISSILRTAGAALTGPAVCPIGEVVELAGARVCVILPSRMFMTSRRSSSSADSRDMLMLRRPVFLVTCTSAQYERKGSKVGLLARDPLRRHWGTEVGAWWLSGAAAVWR